MRIFQDEGRWGLTIENGEKMDDELYDMWVQWVSSQGLEKSPTLWIKWLTTVLVPGSTAVNWNLNTTIWFNSELELNWFLLEWS